MGKQTSWEYELECYGMFEKATATKHGFLKYHATENDVFKKATA